MDKVGGSQSEGLLAMSGRAIQSDEPVSPSGADGRAAFLVAAAADRAIRAGGPVRIDDEGAVRDEARAEVTGL